MTTGRTEDDSWDVTEGVGATALGVAWARARESSSKQPLFTDPHAQQFIDAASERGWSPPSRAITERIAHLGDYAAARTKWFDEFFIAAGANGVEQAVILAAGLDARAWRLPWTSTTRIYEIDQPQVLAFKVETLRNHGVKAAARYTAVAVDLRQDWPTALRDNGFDASEPTAWSAEGLLSYLPAAGQDLLFARVHELSAAGSRFAVEAFGPDFFDPEYLEDRSDVADWLANHGWRTSVTPAANLLEHYHRDVPDVMPRTEFVSGELLSC
ncbi:SAM-dependent methyltransferase [Mycolicibacterium arenosum]|uniref:S-adenosyl-L-methionine-dependent methyltransferase n=1 Tax=Mycolicibacterium arenosum TaxID=2952157 RepID=A0ABT1LYK9_9MYCO|nr:SAM-dependent methyltransferase [Mycolicibacterium sp. CAU 1645]MCP9271984.1 SAM-dependent methyltransferase [Mycolicibacterium sp. CAU 1645]